MLLYINSKHHKKKQEKKKEKRKKKKEKRKKKKEKRKKKKEEMMSNSFYSADFHNRRRLFERFAEQNGFNTLNADHWHSQAIGHIMAFEV